MPKPKNKYDREHLHNLDVYQEYIDAIYAEAVKEAAAIGVSLDDVDISKPFTFDDYPKTRKRVNALLEQLRSQLQMSIVNAVRSEWTLSNNKNNELCNVVFGNNVGKLSEEQYRRYYSTNEKALEAFIKRKERGLNLSDRVWNYSNTFKREMEMGLDLGIREGLDAPSMARDLKQYLRHPDKLFRRVRDEHGNLHLSKNAADFHPGRGVYRSSYLNARRLAATETNIAYRTADHERWQRMDFVVGIEIHLSNNHNCKGFKPGTFHDICDQLKGKYPKDFKFTGWHPHCRCYATTILKTDDEIEADTQKILRGEPLDGESVNKVEDVPEGFKEWEKKNEERIAGAKKAGMLPGFVRENERIVSGVKAAVDTPIKGKTSDTIASANDIHRKENTSEARVTMEDVAKKVRLILSPMQQKLYASFEPFSPIVAEAMARLKDKKKKLALFREILEDERVEILNDTGKTKTVVFPGHKGVGKSSWEATAKAAEHINEQGGDVIFLPELDNETSSDALILYKGNILLSDFKCPTKHNWNSLQKAMDHGFTQANNIVLFADGVKFDAGLINDALGYLQRNRAWVGNVMLVNEYGKIKNITYRDIKRGRYVKIIKGFL